MVHTETCGTGSAAVKARAKYMERGICHDTGRRQETNTSSAIAKWSTSLPHFATQKL